jgi:hypothetical protein
MRNNSVDRASEWFVPKFGPAKFRSFVGLLFLPYTGMVLSFSVIGTMMATPVYWDRVIAIVIILFFGLGIGAHALDALGSKEVKPWGAIFTPFQLWLLATTSLIVAYAIAIFYMIRYVPLLWSMALCEGFFVFSYNLEWFQGRFHTDAWFAFSWGFLPVLSGYIIQTNSISLAALALAASMAFFSLIEIKASRPYRALKRRSNALREEEQALMITFETILKSVRSALFYWGQAYWSGAWSVENHYGDHLGMTGATWMFSSFQEYWQARKPELDDALNRALSGLLNGITLSDASSLMASLEAGKRIRGGITCMVSESLGGALESAVPRAISVEMIQAATLIHDDFVDQDTIRRGGPATWTVEGARRAVLIGDVIFASAIEMMSDLSREDGAAVSHAR